MPPDLPDEDEPRRYTVRLSEPAEAEIEAAYLHLMGLASFEFADRWQNNLFRAVNDLSLFPMRYEAVPGATQSSSAARRMVYRQGRIAYRILFELVDEDDDGQADTVVILHTRHGAQQPLGEAEDEQE